MWLAGVTLALTVARVPFGTALRMLLPDTAAGYYAGLVLSEFVLWGLPALALGAKPRVRSAVRPDLRAGACAFLLGGALQASLSAVTTMLGASGEAAVQLPQTGAEWLLGIAALVIVPAVCEEAFFRGTYLAGQARRMPTAVAFGASALVFALMHGLPSGLPGHLTVGIIASLILLAGVRTGPCVLFHLGYNGAALGLAFCPRMDWLALLALPVLAAGVWLARRIRWRRDGNFSLAEIVLLTLTLLAELYWYLA